MVDWVSQIGVHQGLAGWPLASSGILNRHKDRIDPGQKLGIADLHNPAGLLLIVKVEGTEAASAWVCLIRRSSCRGLV